MPSVARQHRTALNQPIGHPLPGWSPARHPGHIAMTGQYARLEPLDADRHCADLFAAFSTDPDGAIWTYSVNEPFAREEDLKAWLRSISGLDAQPFFAIIDAGTGQANGIASYLRIEPDHGVIEVGSITFSPLLQRSRVASEAMFLMMARVFNDLGYRRYEWKCDALNAPSRRAAERLGFTFEGVFRQALVYKRRNRDTAWFSILDSEWPAIERAFLAWLEPGNFDAQGMQKLRLADLIAAGRGQI
jgi:RimJ/RimL family protein N-acetyltransferase